MASIEPDCTDLHGRPLTRICTDLHEFDVARICMETVQEDPQMHGVARIPRSCLIIFTGVHVTARQFPDIYIYIYVYVLHRRAALSDFMYNVHVHLTRHSPHLM